ncbi:hypothetical protein ASD37_04975 [Mycobacterium sp. Root135]|uniref:DUF5313 domain-containing protein n=1 Tax=Mycobacterium sp. Root135 TaxID=1736457 RepID=UPI0006F6C74A|nr:DUF5313 domain-containing protein [Mycobacterium sp. Root135]KQY10305.1 hypothetical protein ASD37_04975 [Mycobacterium sp. Root135]
MSNEAGPAKPGVLQYIGYCYGKRLPNSMRQWVADDLAGPGATRRMMLRMVVPAVLILTPFWIVPMSLYLHLSTTVPILIPFIFFSHALNKVWRRHMLRKHGLDTSLVDYRNRQRDAHIHDAYAEKYGPRSGPPSSSAV